MSRLAFTMSALLAGCAATLDTANTVTTEVTTAATSEATYRTVITAMRRCYTVPSIKVEGDYFPEAKQGAIRLIWGNDVGVIEWMQIDVAQAGAGSIVRGKHRAAQNLFAPALGAWTRGDATNCPYS